MDDSIGRELARFVIVALITALVRWELGRQARIDPIDGRLILRFGWCPLLGTMVGLTIFGGILTLGLDHLGVANWPGMANLVLCGLGCLVCGSILVELTVYRLTVDAQGLRRRTTQRLACELGWDEIQEVAYLPFRDGFQVRGFRGELIWVPRILVGVHAFVAGCRQHLEPARFERARIQFAEIEQRLRSPEPVQFF